MEKLTAIKVSSYPLRKGITPKEIVSKNRKIDGNKSFQLSTADLPGLHFEPPRLYCERPRLYFLPLKLLNFDFNADPDPALMRIRPDPDPQLRTTTKDEVVNLAHVRNSSHRYLRQNVKVDGNKEKAPPCLRMEIKDADLL
jgi:hypothetical protein